MKIIQAITSLGVGGAERVVLTLASRIPADHIHSAVVCFSSETDALEVFATPVEVRVFEMKRGLIVAAVALWSYAGFLRTYRPNLVHTHLFHAFLITVLAQILSLHFCPVIFTLHSGSCPPFRSWILRILRRWRSADVVFSEAERDASWLGLSLVIPNGVDLPEITAPHPWQSQEGTTFIYVGRLVQEKCPAELVVELANADIPEWKLLIVGNGPHLDRVRATIDELNLAGRVALLGRRSDIRSLLRSADVFLCFSDREGLPMAMLEAGAEGLVVVSTPVGAVPDLLSGQAGYLANKNEYARVLRQVVADRVEARARARMLQSRVARHYSTEAMILGHLALYDQVIGRTVDLRDTA